MIVHDGEDGGVAGTIADLFLRARFVILAVMVLAAMLALGLTGHAILGVAPIDLVFAAASLILVALASFVHSRHIGLAVVVCLAPLPGLAWSTMLMAGMSLPNSVPSYVCALAVAFCVAGDMIRRIGAGEDKVRAASGALRAAAGPALALIVALAAFVLVWMVWPAAGMRLFLETGMGIVSALIVVPLAASMLVYSETFLATLNRAGERRARFFGRVAMVAVPRWGLSIAGIALVFAVLGWFGARGYFSSQARLGMPAFWIASVIAIFLLALGQRLGWRNAVAISVTLAVVSLVALAAYGKLGPLPVHEWILLAAVTLFLCFTVGVREGFHRSEGDEDAVARLRAIEDAGGSLAFAAAAMVAALLPWMIEFHRLPVFAGLLIFAAAASLLFAPAIATSVEVFLPRRRTVDELYGRG
jgi:hypothetical protein